jgi:hypothetical protein
MIAAVVLILSAGPAAAGTVTGNSLLEQCRADEKLGSEPNMVNAFRAEQCHGFASGISTSFNRVLWCIPDDVELGQIILVVTKHLKENPEKLHGLAAALVVAALREAWPCPK